MPYFCVVDRKRIVREREIVGGIWWHRISFVTPWEVGPKKPRLVGDNQIQIEVMSHDDAIIRVRHGEFTFHLIIHELGNQQPVLDIGKTPLANNSIQDNIRAITLTEGEELPIHKTTIMFDEHEHYRIEWSPEEQPVTGLF